MISQYDVPSIILSSFRKEIDSNHSMMQSLQVDLSLGLYESVYALSGITKKATESRDYNLLRRCFLVAEQLYTKGDRLVKAVLENIYIYSLSSCVAINKKMGMCYKSLMPAGFYSIYVHQIIDSRS